MVSLPAGSALVEQVAIPVVEFAATVAQPEIALPLKEKLNEPENGVGPGTLPATVAVSVTRRHNRIRRLTFTGHRR